MKFKPVVNIRNAGKIRSIPFIDPVVGKSFEVFQRKERGWFPEGIALDKVDPKIRGILIKGKEFVEFQSEFCIFIEIQNRIGKFIVVAIKLYSTNLLFVDMILVTDLDFGFGCKRSLLSTGFGNRAARK